MMPSPSPRAGSPRAGSPQVAVSTTSSGAILLAAALLLFACGDDPKPRPGPGGGSAGATETGAGPDEIDPAQRPRVDAFRQAAGWRLTVSAPLLPTRDFAPTVVLIEDRDGKELSRAPFAAGGVGFDLERKGPIRCVLLDAAGRRLVRDFELP